MKTRKLTLCAFAAIAALATACSNDEPTSTDTPKKGVVIEAIASIPQGGADTRLTHTEGVSEMNIVWAAGDNFTALAFDGEQANYVLQGEANKASASFTGTWDIAPEESDPMFAVYPATESGDTEAIPLTLEGQDGTLAGLKNFNYMTAYSEDASSFQFNHQVAIVKLVLNFPAGVTGSASNIGLKATGLNKSATFNLMDSEFTEFTPGDVTTGTNALTIGDDGKLTAYLCVFPRSINVRDGEILTDVKAIAKVGTDDYEVDLSDLKIEAGNMYTAKVTLKNKKDIALHIGDFYMSDGTTISQDVELTDDQKANCIGIVLKVGKDPHDDCSYTMKDGVTAMTEIKGYVLALNYANQGNPCIWSPHLDVKIGTYVGADSGTFFPAAIAFGGYGDTKKITSHQDYSAENFPAAYHAINYESEHIAPANSSGWFLPSAGLVNLMRAYKDVISTNTEEVSGNSSWESCWSSSEFALSSAWYMRIDFDYIEMCTKDDTLHVRSVLVF